MDSITLASGSPRRKEFFKLLGIPFNAIPADIDESITANTDGKRFSSELALKKVEKVLSDTRANPPAWIFGADTVIEADNRIYGKAENRSEAAAMLRDLSGKRHQVITSMALYNRHENKTDCRSVSCGVIFSPLTDAEIEWYLDTNEWQGAAGAYRIQGIAACFIDRIEGSPSNVMGLPLRDFYVMLKDNGYDYGA